MKRLSEIRLRRHAFSGDFAPNHQSFSPDETGGVIVTTHRTKGKVPQQKQTVRNTSADHASAAMPDTAIAPGHRCEARMDYRDLCSYEVLESIGKGSVVIRQGNAFALNWSVGGMLFLIALAPHTKQLIEVRTSRSGWVRTVNIFETRWTKSIQVGSQGNLYLVGCRRIFAL